MHTLDNLSSFMPPSRGPVADYFVIRDDNSCICQCVVDEVTKQKCNEVLVNYHSGNLSKHIQKKHPAIYAKLEASKRKLLEAHKRTKENSVKQSKQMRIDKCSMNTTFCLMCEFSPKLLEEAALREITIDGRPFSAVEDSGFKLLLKPYQDALKKAGIPFTVINRKSVKEMMTTKVQKLRSYLQSLMKNRMICIKMDAAVRGAHSFLGVNTQFTDNGKFHLVTLGCLVFNQKHTGVNIASKVVSLLREFNVSESQIYSITTDNGANFIKSVKDLNQLLADKRSTTPYAGERSVVPENDTTNDGVNVINNMVGSIINSSDDENSLSIDEIQEYEVSINSVGFSNSSADLNMVENNEFEFVPGASEQNIENVPSVNRSEEPAVAAAVPSVSTNEEEYEENEAEENQFLNDVEDTFYSFDDIVGVRCSAHTMQLAVSDTFKEPDLCGYAAVLEKGRNCVKKLRTKNIQSVFQNITSQKPILDNTTRWMSTYDMVVQLKNLKDAIHNLLRDYDDDDDRDLTALKISNKEWKVIDELIDALKPTKNATINLQKADINFCQFYKIWTMCIIETSKINNLFAEKMERNLRTRERVLFNNVSFLSAMFLHPDFRKCLSKDKKDKAKQHLTDLFKKVIDLKGNERPNNPELNPQAEQSTSLPNNECEIENNSESELLDDPTEMEFRSHLEMNNEEELEIGEQSQTDIMVKQFQADLDEYLKCKPTPLPVSSKSKTADLLNYWKRCNPSFYTLGEIILSVPCTQCSVERLFSNLRFILGELRQSMLPQNVNDILFLRLNREYISD